MDADNLIGLRPFAVNHGAESFMIFSICPYRCRVSEMLCSRTRFLQMQQLELHKAAQRITQTYQVWQALLAKWLHAQDRVKALRVLELRHIERRGVQLHRLEQRQHDELAQNTRFWRNDSETVM